MNETNCLPDWASRQLLADALRAVGLPVIAGAMFSRRTPVGLTHRGVHDAIALEGRVVAEARRRLPPGVPTSALGRAWRDSAWRCVVAAIAGRDDGHDHPRPRPPAATRSMARPAAAPVARAPFKIRRGGGVSRAT